jgi:hypothetical protein
MSKSPNETVQLETPVKRGEQTITEIELRKPAAGELRGTALSALLQMDVDALTAVVPRISQPSLTTDEVRKLDPADLVQIGGAVAGFLLTKRAKGEI